jgi:hypothetical protein
VNPLSCHIEVQRAKPSIIFAPEKRKRLRKRFIILIIKNQSMKKSRLVILLFTLMMSIASFAQKQTFSGTVVDSNGDAVIGASVVLKGTSV